MTRQINNWLKLTLSLFTLVAFATIACTVTLAATPTVVGAVYTQTNAPNGAINSVYEWARNSDGTLTFVNSYSAGGKGRGPAVESQGSVILSSDNAWLFAVDAGSNSVAVFSVGSPNGLTLIGTVSSGGTFPVSLTMHGNLLYVLNAGATTTKCSSISGFTFSGGVLTPLVGSTLPLTTCLAAPSEIAFSPDGTLLFVDERNTNNVDAFTVDNTGLPTFSTSQVSPSGGPFGFVFDNNDHMMLIQAANSSVSSFSSSPTGVLSVISNSVKDLGAAACWISATNNLGFSKQYLYVDNTVSHSVSSYTIASDGTVTLLAAKAAVVSGSHPLDNAISPDGNYLYVNDKLVGQIAAYQINSDGSLTSIAGATGVPPTVVGLAVR